MREVGAEIIRQLGYQVLRLGALQEVEYVVVLGCRVVNTATRAVPELVLAHLLDAVEGS